MKIKRWILPEATSGQIDNLSKECGLPWIISAVLASRGVLTKGQAREFLSNAAQIENPYVLKDMDKAVKRITEAIEDGERIAVYGDYDCDGVTATVLLTSYLQSVGADVIYYVPSREKEGYGLNNAAIEMLKGQKTDLILTVDNGISAHSEVDFANSLGIDVVITDHHTPRETMPDAIAVINPHRSDCGCAYKELAGVGVAFKLVCALENAEPGELLEYYSDLVALGTIADVVPLTGENRIIVKHGVSRLFDSERPGIRALIEISGLAGKELSCESVAFGIIPRINAAGRMGPVDDVIELLLTDDDGYAGDISKMVDEQNRERKKIEDDIFEEIEGIFKVKQEILAKRVLIVSGEGWHHGVMGIVAAKLMEKYGKPCVLLSIDGQVARGSGRSIEGFSLIEAITACSENLTQFGGHVLAAGLTLPSSRVDDFSNSMQEFARQKYKNMPIACIKINCELPSELMNVENIALLKDLEPFGSANETPVFLLRGFKLEGIYPTSDKKHIRIRLFKDGVSVYAVYFRMSAQQFAYQTGDVVDIAANISTNEFNGKIQLSIKVKDIRPVNADQESVIYGNQQYISYRRGEYDNITQNESFLPDRDSLAVIYRFLKRHGDYTFGPSSMYFRIADDNINYFKMLLSLDVMQELGLITRTDDNRHIALIEQTEKVKIESSQILHNLKTEMQVNRCG